MIDTQKALSGSLYIKRYAVYSGKKSLSVSQQKGAAPSYFEAKWNYNYIEMAINEVITYENSVQEQINHENKQKAAIEKFEAWSGQEV